MNIDDFAEQRSLFVLESFFLGSVRGWEGNFLPEFMRARYPSTLRENGATL